MPAPKQRPPGAAGQRPTTQQRSARRFALAGAHGFARKTTGASKSPPRPKRAGRASLKKKADEKALPREDLHAVRRSGPGSYRSQDTASRSDSKMGRSKKLINPRAERKVRLWQNRPISINDATHQTFWTAKADGLPIATTGRSNAANARTYQHRRDQSRLN